ncbi:hypothetical protein AM593_02284, partial [Mytilus galloprovincialis]
MSPFKFIDRPKKGGFQPRNPPLDPLSNSYCLVRFNCNRIIVHTPSHCVQLCKNGSIKHNHNKFKNIKDSSIFMPYFSKSAYESRWVMN